MDQMLEEEQEGQETKLQAETGGDETRSFKRFHLIPGATPQAACFRGRPISQQRPEVMFSNVMQIFSLTQK